MFLLIQIIHMEPAVIPLTQQLIAGDKLEKYKKYRSIVEKDKNKGEFKKLSKDYLSLQEILKENQKQYNEENYWDQTYPKYTWPTIQGEHD